MQGKERRFRQRLPATLKGKSCSC